MMSNLIRFSVLATLATVLGTVGSEGGTGQATKEKPERSIAGQWKITRGEIAVNYHFQEGGKLHLQVKSPYFVQNQLGKWEQNGNKITARLEDSGKPGTGGFVRGRELKVKITAESKLMIDGESAVLVARPMAGSGLITITPERMLSVADEMKRSMKYEPKNGTTFCNEFVREYLKTITGRDLPELAGQANDQIDQLSRSSDWDEASLVFDEHAPGTGKAKTLKELQHIQNQGKVVLYSRQEKPHGHIAIGMPLNGKDMLTSGTWGSPGKPVPVPAIAQAGEKTFSYGRLSDGFRAEKRRQIRVFIYKK